MALAVDLLELAPALHARGTNRLPGSKSVSNRMLLLCALAKGTTEIEGLLESDDTLVMRDALRRLGVQVETIGERVIVHGVAGRFPIVDAELFVGNSGLSIRTLVPAIAAAFATCDRGSVVLRGVSRMHERPIADLAEALKQWGVSLSWLGQPGYPPLRIDAATLVARDIRVRGNTSSQFLTGLLQAAPLLAIDRPIAIEVEGELISRPYIDLTLGLMKRFGIDVDVADQDRFLVAPGQQYRSPGRLRVEGDASSASYFLAAGAIAGGPVRVEGVGRLSAQGDIRFADALEQMGAAITWGDDWIESARVEPLRGIDLDCNHIPDAAMTLAVCALHAVGTTTLRGIGSWRVKETDRIAAMATELRKFGARVDEGADWLRITPPTALEPAEVDTYDDHRMAMSLALASLGSSGVTVRIREPGCVAKTFPHYFDALAQIVVR